MKLGLAQVSLLQNVCAVLEPFQHATLQLSNDAACISEVPNIRLGHFGFLIFTDGANPDAAQRDLGKGFRQR